MQRHSLHIVRSLKMCIRMPVFVEVKMRRIKEAAGYFSRGEIALWSASVLLIALSFCAFDRENHLTLLASVIGVTSLIFNAKGNPFGQLLMVVFSLLYGIISFSFRYFGEMVTYLGMTMPMAILALISWMKHPYNGNRAQVRVNQISRREWPFVWIATTLTTVVFFFILRRFRTAHIVPSTLSVATSFLAVYLTFRRSPYFALAYALNDVVLILLWLLASASDVRYLSVAICFLAFLVNDIYGFLSWRSMGARQRA